MIRPIIQLFCYSIIPLLLVSCAKEIYNSEDAAHAKREAQKVGLTIMVRDIGAQTTDMSGFTVSSSQCGELIQGVTSTDGIAGLMVVKGDAIVQIQKEGYVPATAVVTTRETEKERNNTVVIIPVFSEQQVSGTLQGIVSVETRTSSVEPLAGAYVSINVDINALMRLAFPGMGDLSGNYQPGALTYSSAHLMQPVLTNASGAFQFTIPVTMAELTYTVNIHETALTSDTFCSAQKTVITNGQNASPVFFQLTPYSK